MNRAFFILPILLVALSACEKKEVPIDPSGAQAEVAGMGDDYKTMLYFNVNTGQFVRKVSHIEYDLQFENTPEGRDIFLNSSNFAEAQNAGVVNFESVNDTASGAQWRYDWPTGNRDRLALNWYDEIGNSKNEVYIVNRGFDELGKSLGMMKMMVLSANTQSFTIRYATLNNSHDTTVTIAKNIDKERTQFWFESGTVVDIEPNIENWHLRFTQYTDYDLTEEGDTLKYIVRGVLINQEKTSAAKLIDVDFETVSLADAQSAILSNHRNAIGYDWKVFSLDQGQYEVRPNLVYIIREASGNFYKLRFVDYYNDAGEKGYAKFEIISL